MNSSKIENLSVSSKTLFQLLLKPQEIWTEKLKKLQWEKRNLGENVKKISGP